MQESDRQDIIQRVKELNEEQKSLGKTIDENKKIKTELDNQILKKRKEELDKTKNLKSVIESEDLLDIKVDIRRVIQDIEDRKHTIPFLFPGTEETVLVAPHSMPLICGMTGNGKSSLTAAIAAPLVSSGQKVLIMGNEEASSDARARVSCIRTKISYGGYKNNKLTQEQYVTVIKDIKAMEENLVVLGNEDDVNSYRTTNVDGVILTLNQAKNKFDLIILDYIQNVTVDDIGTSEPHKANNRLAFALDVIKNTASCPIIVFAQCRSITESKKQTTEEKYASSHPVYRWVGGTEILRKATDVIELVSDFKNSRSLLYVHKRRFQDADFNPLLLLGFDKQRQTYVPYNKEFELEVENRKLLSAVFTEKEDKE
jgi:replicative DNA helicase